MTDNAHAAQRLRALLVREPGIFSRQEEADLRALLDDHAALLAAAPPAPDITDVEHVSLGLGDSKTRLRFRRRPLSGRLEWAADGVFTAACNIERTHPGVYQTLIGHIINLRVEAEQARAAETKAAGR